MNHVALDVAGIPDHGFGHRSIMWWGTASMMVIEGMVFALSIISYVYLKGRAPQWPPSGPPPRLLWGTLNTVILVVSCVPNALAKKAAEKLDVRAVKIWLAVCLLFALAFNIVRFFEFGALNVRWDQNAYGSIVWLLVGYHTTHIITDFLDSLVLGAIVFTNTDVSPRRLVDVSENALYWYFVIIAWIPIYAVVYFGPRIS